MNLLGLETFMAIVETQSLSGASKKLFLSQSTVSNRLNTLERDLGVQLIDRSQGQRFVKLTSKGEEFVNIAKRWLMLQKNTDLWANEESSHKLNIGSVDSLNFHLLIDVYGDILQNEPSFQLKISSHWSTTILQLLESYEVDIGLVSRSIKSDNLLTKPLFSEKLVVVSNPIVSNIDDYISTDDLDVSNEIFLDWGSSFQIWHDSCWDPSISKEICVDTVGLVFKFLERPQSWAILPEPIALYYSETHGLKISKFVNETPERIIYKAIHRDPLPRVLPSLNIFESYLQKSITNNPLLKEFEAKK